MSKGKILLIEDNPLQAKQTQAVVESAGYEVTVADSGAAGFKLARTERPDLVLLDVVLPDFTGDQICQWIKKDEASRAIPVIMLTAKASLEDKVAGLQVGADDYLPKPFNDKELVARIQACLRNKVMRDELRGRNDQLETLLKDVEQKAITDGVTGLHTRLHFNDLLEKEFSRAVRYSEPLSCLMIDIDHFKEINDTYGHPVGDQVLAEIGGILKESVRLIEVAARYGGEEFVLLFPKTPVRDALKPAARLLQAIASRHFQGLPRKQMVTVSIGLAGLPDPALKGANDLVRCADFALYKAKRNGRNRIEAADGAELKKSKP